MALIKVTGFLDTDDLDPDLVDLGHETGLSEAGYLAVHGGDGPTITLAAMTDIETELVDGD